MNQVATWGCMLAIHAWLAVTVVLVLRRSPYTLAQSLLYFVNVAVTRTLWRAEISGPLPIEPGQGAVVISNHRSSIDPCFIQLSAGRVVHWMVANDFQSHPLIGRVLRFCQTIPTRRSGIDTAATKIAIRYASSGGVVGMFPEGRINRGSQLMMPVRPGAVLVAAKAGVPIIPCYIEGSPFDGSPLGALLMPARVRMKVGQPIDLSKFPNLDHDRQAQGSAMLHCVSEIAKLAGQEQFAGKLAARKWVPDDSREATPSDETMTQVARQANAQAQSAPSAEE